MKNDETIDEQYAEYAEELRNDPEEVLRKESVIKRRAERERERVEKGL